jgi:2-methylcitrate dehydratase
MDPDLATAEGRLVSSVLQPLPGPPLERSTAAAARYAVLDSVAVGLGARDHPAAHVARRHVGRHLGGSDVGVWGSGQAASLEGAVITNTVPLRCYDFNDVLHGLTGQAGHPSDIVPGLMAVAEFEHLSGRALLEAVVTAYDTSRLLFDLVDVTSAGWDYTNLTGLGAVAGFVRLLGLAEQQGSHALGIFASSHLSTNQLESGDLSESGNLTMWKRFNGADAVLAALRACRLASSGVEGPSYSLLGDDGFFRRVGADPAQVAAALDGVVADPRRGVEVTEFKSWPVGTRAQSAIEAALTCRARLAPDARIDAVLVEAEAAVVRHLVRAEAWKPYSRETADHSLPFAVVIALLEQRVGIDHFETKEYFQSPQVIDLLSKLRVESLPDPVDGSRSSYPTRVTIESGGMVHVAQAEYPPERIRAAAFGAELEQKFSTLVGRYASSGQAGTIRDLIERLDELDDVKTLGDALSVAMTGA